MRILAIKYFSWIWIFSLLTATMGISVQQLYCYCIGKTSVSLFSIEDACRKMQAENRDACCKKESVPGCDKHKKVKPEHGCTKKSTKVFQLKTEFVVDKPFEKNFDIPVWISGEPFFRWMMRPVLCLREPANKAPPCAPPPLSGRTLCVRHQLFLC